MEPSSFQQHIQTHRFWATQSNEPLLVCLWKGWHGEGLSEMEKRKQREMSKEFMLAYWPWLLEIKDMDIEKILFNMPWNTVATYVNQDAQLKDVQRNRKTGYFKPVNKEARILWIPSYRKQPLPTTLSLQHTQGIGMHNHPQLFLLPSNLEETIQDIQQMNHVIQTTQLHLDNDDLTVIYRKLCAYWTYLHLIGSSEWDAALIAIFQFFSLSPPNPDGQQEFLYPWMVSSLRPTQAATFTTTETQADIELPDLTPLVSGIVDQCLMNRVNTVEALVAHSEERLKQTLTRYHEFFDNKIAELTQQGISATRTTLIQEVSSARELLMATRTTLSQDVSSARELLTNDLLATRTTLSQEVTVAGESIQKELVKHMEQVQGQVNGGLGHLNQQTSEQVNKAIEYIDGYAKQRSEDLQKEFIRLENEQKQFLKLKVSEKQLQLEDKTHSIELANQREKLLQLEQSILNMQQVTTTVQVEIEQQQPPVQEVLEEGRFLEQQFATDTIQQFNWLNSLLSQQRTEMEQLKMELDRLKNLTVTQVTITEQVEYDLSSPEEMKRTKAEEREIRAKEEKQEKDARLNAEKEEKDARLKAEKEAKEEKDARVKAEKEARLKAEKEAKEEKEARLKAEKDARLKAEKEARLKAEKEARLKAEKEAKGEKALKQVKSKKELKPVKVKVAKVVKEKAQMDLTDPILEQYLFTLHHTHYCATVQAYFGGKKSLDDFILSDGRSDPDTSSTGFEILYQLMKEQEKYFQDPTQYEYHSLEELDIDHLANQLRFL